MIIQCDQKGCYSVGEHLLDETDKSVSPDGQVFCIDCGKPINVPRSTKVILKQFRQVKRKVKEGLAFTCKACNHTARPILKKLANKTTVANCPKCNQKMDIHPSFIEALKSMAGSERSNETGGQTEDT